MSRNYASNAQQAGSTEVDMNKMHENKIKKVMHEFKAGTLNIGKSKHMVKSKAQAIAIALQSIKKGK